MSACSECTRLFYAIKRDARDVLESSRGLLIDFHKTVGGAPLPDASTRLRDRLLLPPAYSRDERRIVLSLLLQKRIQNGLAEVQRVRSCIKTYQHYNQIQPLIEEMERKLSAAEANFQTVRRASERRLSA